VSKKEECVMKESAADTTPIEDSAPSADGTEAAEAVSAPRAIVRVVSVVASWRRQEGVS
jgi:hypothetical protein